MASFNFLKEWKTTIGGLHVQQTAQPFMDGERLHVITGWHIAPLVYFNGSSTIPFADVDKLQDDAFRLELARAHMAKRARELREGAAAVEKALGADPEPRGQTAAEVRAELEAQIRNCACMDSDGCRSCRDAQAAIDALAPVVAAEARQ